MRKAALFLSTTLAVLVLAGCGFDMSAPGPDLTSPGASQQPAVGDLPPGGVGTGVPPKTVDVPSIGAHSTLTPLGVNPDGTVQTPSVHHPQQAGFVRVANPNTPLVNDPWVILGHIDGDHQQGVFFRLHSINVGDKVTLTMADGSTRGYHVTRFRQISKQTFPTQEVYGPAPGPEVVLVSCGGPYDAAHKNYLDSELAWATEDAPAN